MSEHVESDYERAFRLLNTVIFRAAIINSSYYNLDLKDEATRNEFLRIAEDPIALRYFEEMVFVRRHIPPWLKFRNQGDPEGIHWNTTAPTTKQNEPSTSNHNVQPTANIIQTASTEPTNNPSEPNTSNQDVQPTTNNCLQTVSSAPTTNFNAPDPSNQPPTYNNDQNAPLMQYAQPAPQQEKMHYAQPAPTQGMMQNAQPVPTQGMMQNAQPVPTQGMMQNAQPAPQPEMMHYAQPAPTQGMMHYAQPAPTQGMMHYAQPAPTQGMMQNAQTAPTQGMMQNAQLAPTQGMMQNAQPAPHQEMMHYAQPAPTQGVMQNAHPAPHQEMMHYAQPAPQQGMTPYQQAPYGMMVPHFQQQNMFPNGMAASNNSHNGYYLSIVPNGVTQLMEIPHHSYGYGNHQPGYSGHAPHNNSAWVSPHFPAHHYSRPAHFPNRGQRRGSYANRRPYIGNKPWIPREEIGREFRYPAESYNLGPAKLNMLEADSRTQQSHQINTLAPGTSQYADLERQIGVALDREFAAYPDKDAPNGRVLGGSGAATAPELKESKSSNVAPSSSAVTHPPEAQQNEKNTVAKVATPALSEISSRALSVANAALPTAEKNPLMTDDSSSSTSATVSPGENVPDPVDSAENVAIPSKTEPELQETPILSSSSFRDAVLRNRTENAQITTPIRSNVPPKQQTNAHISTKRPANVSKQASSAVASKPGSTRVNNGKGKLSVANPVSSSRTAAIVSINSNSSKSSATESNTSVSQIVKKKPPPPVLVIKNKFSHLSIAQEENEKESVEDTAVDITDDKKVDVASKPARKPKSDRKKNGKAAEKAKKKLKKSDVSNVAATEKKEENKEAEPEKETAAASIASEEKVLEFEREHAEETPKNEDSSNAEESVEAVVGLINGEDGGRDEDVAVNPDINSAATEEEDSNEVNRVAQENSELNEAEGKYENGVGGKPKKSKKSKSKKQKKVTEGSETVTALQLAIPEESRSRFYVKSVEDPVPQDPTMSAVDYANSAIDRFQSCIGPPVVQMATSGSTPSEISSGLRNLSIEGVTQPMALVITDTWQKRVKRQVLGRLTYFSKYLNHSLEKSIPEWEGKILFLDKKERDFKRRERDQRLKGFLKRQAGRTNEKHINFIGYMMMCFYRILSDTYITEMGPMLLPVALLESRGAEFDAEEWRLMKLLLDNPTNTEYERIALSHQELYVPDDDFLF